jgi:hypothetical protein
MTTVKPITPKEVQEMVDASLPGVVFEVFNKLIIKYWNGENSATIKQEEAALEIADAMSLSIQQVMSRGYLNIEQAYRKAGWSVVYDAPAYNEDYPATFKFTVKY